MSDNSLAEQVIQNDIQRRLAKQQRINTLIAMNQSQKLKKDNFVELAQQLLELEQEPNQAEEDGELNDYQVYDEQGNVIDLNDEEDENSIRKK